MKILKLPVGGDGFFNEIHPKLRPVETIVDGVLIAGTCQSPKSASESVASALAAVTQSGAILKRGVAELDPLVATVNTDACTWCGLCLESCPYAAIENATVDGRQVAVVTSTICKGCGGCTPICPQNAIDLLGSTDAQMRAMIDGLARRRGRMTTTLIRDIREIVREEPLMHRPILEALAGWTSDRASRSPPRSATRPTRSSSGSWGCAATA